MRVIGCKISDTLAQSEIILLCAKVRLDYVAPQYSSNSEHLSDAEFICNLFEKHGDDGINAVEGDFAISYWHNQRQEAVCLTSVFTVFPLYYYYDQDSFAAANEMDQLFDNSEVKRRPNLHYIANMSQRIHSQNKEAETIFENVYYVPGGRVYRFNGRGLQKHKYWQPDINKRYKYKTEQQWSDAIAVVFSEAVNCRIQSAGEQGILLSGGLDSSAMASIAEKTLAKQGKKLYAFSHVLPVNYSGKASDEREYIELFRDKNIELNYLDYISHATVDDLRIVANDMRATASLTAFFTQQKLINLVKEKNVSNLLVGTFSELGMSGYGFGYFTELLLTGRWWSLLRGTRAMAKRYNRNWLRLFVADVLRPAIPESWFYWFSPRLREESKLVKIPFKDGFLAGRERLENAKYGEMFAATNHRQYQVNSINRVMDMNIGAILEVDGLPRSFPFLDRRVVEICLAAPGWMKINNGYTRNIIRRSMRGIMPDKVCTRLGKGAATPCFPEQALAYAKDLKQLINEIPRDSYAAQVLDLDKLSELCGDGSANHATKLSPDNFVAVVPPAISLAYFLNGFEKTK